MNTWKPRDLGFALSQSEKNLYYQSMLIMYKKWM